MDTDSAARGDEGESESAPSITPQEIIVFLVRSAKRHRRLGFGVATTIACVGVAVALLIPSKYEAESRILAAQSALVTSALSNPNRPVRDVVDPFGGSTEILMKKSNLIWIAREAKLLSSWDKTRSRPFLWKDKFFSYISGPLSEDERIRMLADMLEKQMFVMHDPNLLTIHVTWSDPDAVWQIAQIVQTRFLNTRKEQELAAITAAINVNENEVRQAAEGVDQALQELVRSKESRAQSAASPKLPPVLTADAGTPRATESLKKAHELPSRAKELSEPETSTDDHREKKLAARLSELRAKELEIETPWQRRLAELKYQLNDMRAVYGPEHPQILAQQAKISQASQPPPEIATLKSREQELLSEIETATHAENVRRDDARSVRATAVGRPMDDGVRPTPRARLQSSDGSIVIAEKEEDPVIAPAKANLSAAISRYEEVNKRLETARLELTTSQASLEYRYIVVAEPERPRKPSRPKRPPLLAGAVAIAAVLGFLAGAIRDILTGKVFEPWQLKTLGLRIVGELDVTRKP